MATITMLHGAGYCVGGHEFYALHFALSWCAERGYMNAQLVNRRGRRLKWWSYDGMLDKWNSI